MSEPAARRVAVGVITTLLGIVALSAWNAKISRAEFDLHVQENTHWRVNHVSADSAWKAEQRELTLEVLCELKPESRKCR